jgi:hypothetical protein
VKKLLLISTAALFLATGAAHAFSETDTFELTCKARGMRPVYLVVIPGADKSIVKWSYVRNKKDKEYPITEQGNSWIVFGESEEREYELGRLDNYSWNLTLTFERVDERDWVRKCK